MPILLVSTLGNCIEKEMENVYTKASQEAARWASVTFSPEFKHYKLSEGRL